MRILVTGSSGHLGEALMRILPEQGHSVVGFDRKPSDWTTFVGDIRDAKAVAVAAEGAEAIIHTATLHKPHVATHSAQDFISTNVAGTQCLLDAAIDGGAKTFLFTSTTSAFGAALSSPPGSPATWIDEAVRSVPKNIYGATKTAAEDLCELTHRRRGLPVIVLRTSRFFPEEDDTAAVRASFSDENAKANEFLNRRVDIEDAAMAHVAALGAAARIGFGRYIVSARTALTPGDLEALDSDPETAVARHHPEMQAIYAATGNRLPARFDRVYDSRKAQSALGWAPKHDFRSVLAQIAGGQPIGSALSRRIGRKGYHDQSFDDGPYPVD